ncbi:MAG: glycosyltransferase family 4 protein [Solirubrobacteraceae bacterium]
MRIAVDGRHLASGRGVARYSRSLLGALREQHPDDDVRLVTGSRAAFGAAAVLGRPRLDRMAGGADVVWLPAPVPVAVSADVPYVLTVHDLSWLQRPEDFTAYERAWHRAMRFDRLVRGAARVVCDVGVVRDSIIEGWGLAAERVIVVPPGPGLGGVTHVDLRSEGKRARPPYFLVVGALEPRKAPELVLAAHARARSAGLRAGLVFAGASRVAIEGAEVLEPTDDELRALYAGALAVVQPAHLEGFGFPPVEGLAAGTPAIVADLPLYDETIGDGALRFAAGDERALADALLRMEREDGLRERLVAAGQTAIAPLSWERAARELHTVLAEVAG